MNDVIKHLQYLIRRHNKVTISGLGSLKAVELPAFVSPDGGVSLPPTRSIYFEAEESVDTDGLLMHSIMRRKGVDSEVAVKEISRFVVDFRKTLSSRGLFIAGRLGNFYSKNNAIEFKPNRNTSAYNPYEIFELSKVEIPSVPLPLSGRMWGLKRKTMALIGALSTFATALMA